ncbi:hypothetical protein [Actinoplanes sp. GCM10030250]|uniref:hypothetical protein n=1 Tax=Actinoplanes sp. GCM10030250 TaxID=3273376 RepID=UPI0036138D13
MSSTTAGTTRRDTLLVDGPARRRPAETKAAFKTTELIAYVAAVAGVLIASFVVDGNGNGDNGAAGDYFRADRAWFYVVLLTIGYMVSRGLAKAGSRDSADA